MNGTLEPIRWSRPRWYAVLSLVLITQVGIIFWLGSRDSVYPQRPHAVPSLRLASAGFKDMLPLNDPTLFALPHQQGFAGPAWLTLPRVGAEPFVWSEPVSWLMLPVEQLGSVFRSYIASNQFSVPQPSFPLQPDFSQPALAVSADLPAQSRLRLTGQLVGLTLKTAFEVGSVTNYEILTNSVVQLLVAKDGVPISTTLLSSSGSKEADALALRQATHARFVTPLEGQFLTNRARGLLWGQMIFEWHTVLPAPTNAPSAGP